MNDDWNKSEKYILGVVGLSFRQTALVSDRNRKECYSSFSSLL
ncbi:MAG: hypothetical protein ACI4VI_02265 [Acutalibacteraceae bacterium]